MALFSRFQDREILASSVASWRPFPDTADALRALAGRYRLAVILNIDDDMFATTLEQLEIEFDLVVTAEQARCYKPHLAIFKEAFRASLLNRATSPMLPRA